MPERTSGLSLLASRAVQFTLLASWLALVIWKALTYLSEPTASNTRFESQYHKPYLTFCPYFRYHLHNGTSILRANTVASVKWRPQKYDHNLTLLAAIRENLVLLTMMPYQFGQEEFLEDPMRENYSAIQQHWTTNIDYADQRLCGTLEVNNSEALVILNEFPQIQKAIYKIYIHRIREDFWGPEDKDITSVSDSEMVAFDVTASTLHMKELVITVEREILPNMWRQPCVEDPTYSRSMCWRKCFLKSLNCSMEEEWKGRINSKPLCKHPDTWYVRSQYVRSYSRGFLASERNAKSPCACPRPCVLDRYNIFYRPFTLPFDGVYGFHENSVVFMLNIKPVLRVTETSIIYGTVDLLADIGGFLGLLLGYSIMSVLDDAKAFVKRILKQRASKTIASSANIGRVWGVRRQGRETTDVGSK